MIAFPVFRVLQRELLTAALMFVWVLTVYR